MVKNLEVVHVDEPFKISELPLDKVYVIDNYLSTELHHHIDALLTRSSVWSKTNQVTGDNPTGLPMHSFWGASFLRGEELEPEIHRLHTVVPIWFNRRLQTDFQFEWVRFQYMGLNSKHMVYMGLLMLIVQKKMILTYPSSIITIDFGIQSGVGL